MEGQSSPVAQAEYIAADARGGAVKFAEDVSLEAKIHCPLRSFALRATTPDYDDDGSLQIRHVNAG